MLDKSCILVIVIASILFLYTISYKKSGTRSNPDDVESYDGNGVYQYKGRGSDSETIEVLLQRISWAASNGPKKYIFSMAYIIAFVSTIAVFLLLYSCGRNSPNVYEFLLVLLVIYLTTFSILGLFRFHTDRYPYFYIKQNAMRLQQILKCNAGDPPLPTNQPIPHRTVMRDIIHY